MRRGKYVKGKKVGKAPVVEEVGTLDTLMPTSCKFITLHPNIKGIHAEKDPLWGTGRPSEEGSGAGIH